MAAQTRDIKNAWFRMSLSLSVFKDFITSSSFGFKEWSGLENLNSAQVDEIRAG